MCKAITGGRECRRKEWKDGYCKQHHPEDIRQREEADKLNAQERSNYARVGRFLRMKYPDLYNEMLQEYMQWQKEVSTPNRVPDEFDRKMAGL